MTFRNGRVHRALAILSALATVCFTPKPAFSSPPGQPFEVSYEVSSNLDLDSAQMRSWVDISIRLVDSTPCQSLQLSCVDQLTIDSLLVDGARLDTGLMRVEWVPIRRYELDISLSPPMSSGQSKTVSIAYHTKVRTEDFKKGVLRLMETIPLMAWSLRNSEVFVSSEGTYACQANFDYRLTVTPPTLALGEGELLNEAEFITASSKPRNVVLTDLISPVRFGSKKSENKSMDRRYSISYAWNKEGGIGFDLVLLRNYTLDRTWVGQTQVDLYYPRKSKDRWASWAVPVIAEVVKAYQDKRNWGGRPFRFIVDQLRFSTGEPPIFFLPNKKFDASRLREVVDSELRAYLENHVE